MSWQVSFFAFVIVLCFSFTGVFVFYLNKAGGQGEDTEEGSCHSVSALADYNMLAQLLCAQSQALS